MNFVYAEEQVNAEINSEVTEQTENKIDEENQNENLTEEKKDTGNKETEKTVSEKNDSDKKKDEKNKSEAELEKEIKIVQENYLNSLNELHVFLYKDENLEIFSVNKKKNDNKRSFTNYSKDKMRRIFYDDSFDVDYVEYWTVGKTVSESFLNRKKVYSWKNKKENRYSVSEYDFDKLLYSAYTYSLDNLLVSKEEFSFPEVKNELARKEKEEKESLEKEKEEEKEETQKQEIEKSAENSDETEKKSFFKVNLESLQVLNSKRKDASYYYKYDDEKRVQEESITKYSYKYDFSKKPFKKYVRRYVYSYKVQGWPPDVLFYEDGVLRLRTVHVSEKDYTESIFFENDTVVKIDYKNGKKKSEIFYVGDEERFKREYE